MPQWQYNGDASQGRTDVAHFAPGDTIEFKDPLSAEFYFASITSFDLTTDGAGVPERAEECPLTTAVRKTDCFLATCLSPCIKRNFYMSSNNFNS